MSAVVHGREPKLLIIDELGYLPFERRSPYLFFSARRQPLRAREPADHHESGRHPMGHSFRRRLYVGYWVEEPFVEATLTERDAPIYENNDVELFIAGRDTYYEFEINVHRR